jgi:hypothetical protein
MSSSAVHGVADQAQIHLVDGICREQRKSVVARSKAVVPLTRETSFTELLAPPPATRSRGGSLLGVIDAAGVDTGSTDDGDVGRESVHGGKATLAVGVLFSVISLLSFLRGAPARPSPIKLEVRDGIKTVSQPSSLPVKE